MSVGVVVKVMLVSGTCSDGCVSVCCCDSLCATRVIVVSSVVMAVSGVAPRSRTRVRWSGGGVAVVRE